LARQSRERLLLSVVAPLPGVQVPLVPSKPVSLDDVVARGPMNASDSFQPVSLGASDFYASSLASFGPSGAPAAPSGARGPSTAQTNDVPASPPLFAASPSPLDPRLHAQHPRSEEGFRTVQSSRSNPFESSLSSVGAIARRAAYATRGAADSPAEEQFANRGFPSSSPNPLASSFAPTGNGHPRNPFASPSLAETRHTPTTAPSAIVGDPWSSTALLPRPSVPPHVTAPRLLFESSTHQLSQALGAASAVQSTQGVTVASGHFFRSNVGFSPVFSLGPSAHPPGSPFNDQQANTPPNPLSRTIYPASDTVSSVQRPMPRNHPALDSISPGLLGAYSEAPGGDAPPRAPRFFSFSTPNISIAPSEPPTGNITAGLDFSVL
jgi:hypothetical protein